MNGKEGDDNLLVASRGGSGNLRKETEGYRKGLFGGGGKN